MKWLILLSLLFLLNNGNNHIKTVVKQSINQAVTSSFVLIGELKVVCNKNFEDYFIKRLFFILFKQSREWYV